MPFPDDSHLTVHKDSTLVNLSTDGENSRNLTRIQNHMDDIMITTSYREEITLIKSKFLEVKSLS